MENVHEQADSVAFNYDRWMRGIPQDISRRAFARKLGTTDSNLIHIENKKSRPSIILAFKFCIITGTPVQELMKFK